MRLILFSFILLAIYSCEISTSGFDNQKTLVKSHQETKMTLKQQEQLSPGNFVRLSGGTYNKNFFGEWVVRGNIKNTASVATYKDVEINISFYSTTDTYLGSVKRTIQKFFPPESETNFKFQLPDYTKAKKVDIEISDVSNTY